MFIEAVQYFEPERSFEFGDLGVDTLGIALGTVVFLVASRLFKWRFGKLGSY